MIKESDAAVAHPNTMMIYTHYAAVAIQTAMLGSGWHNLSTGLAPCEFTNLRYLSRVVLYLFFLCAAHFQKFNIVIILTNHEHARSLFLRHLYVTHHRTIEAF